MSDISPNNISANTIPANTMSDSAAANGVDSMTDITQSELSTALDEMIDSDSNSDSDSYADINDETENYMAELDLHDTSYYFNRELSWLKFNERVLEEAENIETPLLERLKFLAIFSANLDEFMMIRYAGLKEQVSAGITKLTADGRTPAEQVYEISKRLRPLLDRQGRHLNHVILPALSSYGVKIEQTNALNDADRAYVDAYFQETLFPVLTPLAVDSGRPFPRLPNLSFSVLVQVRDPVSGVTEKAIVQVPNVLSRFFKLPNITSEELEYSTAQEEHRFILSEDLIKYKVQDLFVGYEVERCHVFRITRNADIELAEDEADDLLQVIEDEVRKRRWGDAVRLEVSRNMPKEWVDYLMKNLRLESYDIFRLENFLNVADFMELLSVPLPELRDAPFAARLPSEYRSATDIFSAIRHQDILIHHPFHAFDAVLNLIRSAARDPKVLAIKQTLYRVGKNSPVVAALSEAAGNGKHVTALVELKARFDEENNIVWAKELEKSGVHVVYGFAGLKTHCKSLLIIRQEGDRIRRYVHLSTGNYNGSTSNLYTDMSLLSCDDALGADVSELFNYLTAYSKQSEWRKLWVAPTTLRPKVLEAIDREAEFARAGKNTRIIAKMNSLVDPEVIRHLYEASQAGVKIDLIIRGICCLRPGVPGVSENIRVRSIVGRFLEHSRVFYFKHGGEDNLYLSSADWMQRNLNNRIEAVFPIEDIQLKRKVVQVLDLCLKDNVNARQLGEDGFYFRPERKAGDKRISVQERLLTLSERKRAQTDGL